jgi:cell division protein FtsB
VRFTRIAGTRTGIRRIPRNEPAARFPRAPGSRVPGREEEPGPAARPDGRHLSPSSYFAVSLVFSALVFGFFLVSDRGFLHARRQRNQLAKLQAEVSALDAENRRLEAEVAALNGDPRAVEKIAREQLNLVRPGEVVLVLPDGWRTRVRPPAPAPRGKPEAPPAALPGR